MKQLEKVITKCKSRASFDESVFHLVDRVSRLEGGLTWNWFQVGFDLQGSLGVVCFTCDSNKSLAIGSQPNSGPFNNFITHCAKGKAHAKAVAAAQRQVDGLSHTMPTTSVGMCRDALAALLFGARVSGFRPPATTCTPCESTSALQPAGSEQLGVPTRSSDQRAVPPEIPPSFQQQLDAAVGPGSFLVDETTMLAGCERCSRFKRTCITLSNQSWLKNAQ